MRSMTGFGSGHVEKSGLRCDCEIRGFNHRYLDVRVSGDDVGERVLHVVEQRARSQFLRGRLEVRLRIASVDGAAFVLDPKAARAAVLAWGAIQKQLAPDAPFPWAAVAAAPRLYRPATVDAAGDLADVSVGAFDAAAQVLRLAQEREGGNLQAAMLTLLQRVTLRVQTIRGKMEGRALERQFTLRQRIDGLLGDGAIDPTRLATEVAVHAEKLDVTEELDRLASHIERLGGLLKTGERKVGKSIDFLLQEVNREINTLGAKCQHAEVSQTVASLKVDVEGLREQVQNLA